jgi:hypothetical protein
MALVDTIRMRMRMMMMRRRCFLKWGYNLAQALVLRYAYMRKILVRMGLREVFDVQTMVQLDESVELKQIL